MKLYQLRALVAVADTGSLSRAASLLQVSQSSVSEALMALERHHQARLVERGPQGSQPTPLGQQIVKHARVALQALDTIDQEVALSRGRIQGILRISTFRSVATRWMPLVMGRLREQHPDLQLELLECRICYEENLLAPLKAGQADLAFLPAGTGAPYPSLLLLHDPFVALVPAAWDTGPVFRPADLERFPLVVTRDCDCTSRIQHYLKSHGISPPDVVWVQDDFTMFNMVREQIGVCLTGNLALDYLPEGTRVVPLQETLQRDIRLVVRPGGLENPAIQAFLQELQILIPEAVLSSKDPHF